LFEKHPIAGDEEEKEKNEQIKRTQKKEKKKRVAKDTHIIEMTS
jgi:hypothetical protein